MSNKRWPDFPKTESDFVRDVLAEIRTSRSYFPGNDALLAALTEEMGEVARALMTEPQERVWREAVHVAAMACRLAVEGDGSLEDYRSRHIPVDFTPEAPWKQPS